ncbi:MAG: hypothetical protein DCC68_22245 [Planctomycetota bacterium]|nr:MAG: hypothetical protein DCC68_22245 [Planctomycetota bacterium]
MSATTREQASIDSVQRFAGGEHAFGLLVDRAARLRAVDARECDLGPGRGFGRPVAFVAHGDDPIAESQREQHFRRARQERGDGRRGDVPKCGVQNNLR